MLLSTSQAKRSIEATRWSACVASVALTELLRQAGLSLLGSYAPTSTWPGALRTLAEVQIVCNRVVV